LTFAHYFIHWESQRYKARVNHQNIKSVDRHPSHVFIRVFFFLLFCNDISWHVQLNLYWLGFYDESLLICWIQLIKKIHSVYDRFSDLICICMFSIAFSNQKWNWSPCRLHDWQTYFRLTLTVVNCLVFKLNSFNWI